MIRGHCRSGFSKSVINKVQRIAAHTIPTPPAFVCRIIISTSHQSRPTANPSRKGETERKSHRDQDGVGIFTSLRSLSLSRLLKDRDHFRWLGLPSWFQTSRAASSSGQWLGIPGLYLSAFISSWSWRPTCFPSAPSISRKSRSVLSSLSRAR